ncbi:MAG: hypothetical protein JWN98_2267 [Abditibacteriota bacterium]|nr:hypothetical protein [Abditibacteriota bacterium]
MPRPFNHDLHIVLPRFQCQFTQNIEFAELRGIVGFGQAAGTLAIAQR